MFISFIFLGRIDTIPINKNAVTKPLGASPTRRSPRNHKKNKKKNNNNGLSDDEYNGEDEKNDEESMDEDREMTLEDPPKKKQDFWTEEHLEELYCFCYNNNTCAKNKIKTELNITRTVVNNGLQILFDRNLITRKDSRNRSTYHVNYENDINMVAAKFSWDLSQLKKRKTTGRKRKLEDTEIEEHDIVSVNEDVKFSSLGICVPNAWDSRSDEQTEAKELMCDWWQSIGGILVSNISEAKTGLIFNEKRGKGRKTRSCKVNDFITYQDYLFYIDTNAFKQVKPLHKQRKISTKNKKDRGKAEAEDVDTVQKKNSTENQDDNTDENNNNNKNTTQNQDNNTDENNNNNKNTTQNQDNNKDSDNDTIMNNNKNTTEIQDNNKDSDNDIIMNNDKKTKEIASNETKKDTDNTNHNLSLGELIVDTKLSVDENLAIMYGYLVKNEKRFWCIQVEICSADDVKNYVSEYGWTATPMIDSIPFEQTNDDLGNKNMSSLLTFMKLDQISNPSLISKDIKFFTDCKNYTFFMLFSISLRYNLYMVVWAYRKSKNCFQLIYPDKSRYHHIYESNISLEVNKRWLNVFNIICIRKSMDKKPEAFEWFVMNENNASVNWVVMDENREELSMEMAWLKSDNMHLPKGIVEVLAITDGYFLHDELWQFKPIDNNKYALKYVEPST